MKRPVPGALAPTFQFALLVLIVSSPPTHAQVTSTWLNGVPSGSWFNAANWDNGIPDAAGDVARISASFPQRDVQLAQQATLGRLQLFASGQLNLTGSGPLAFDQPGSAPATLQIAAPNSAAIAAVIAPVISFASTEELEMAVEGGAVLTLSGGIATGSGNLSKTGLGTVLLSGSSAGWTGRLLVSGGAVDVVHAAGLGTTDQGVLVNNGGLLQLRNATSESLELDSGTVVTNATSNVVMTSPVTLTGNGRLWNASTNRSATWSGTISGAGQITLQNSSSQPLIISGNNTYPGHTFLTGGLFRATTATAFGASAEGTTIQSGRLNLEVLTQETFTVQAGGTLALNPAVASYAHPVLLQGGTLSLPNAASLPTPVVVDSAGGTVQLSQGDGNWSGGSTGTGDLRLLGFVVPTSPLNHQGKLTISNARLNIANGYTGETIVTGYSEINHVGATGTSPLIRIQNSAELVLKQLPATNPAYVVESGVLRVENFGQPFASAITLARYDASLWGPVTYNGPITLAAPEGGSHIRGGVINGVISGSGDVDLAWTNGTPSENFDVVLNGANTYTGTTRVYGTVKANTSTALGSAHRGTVVEQGVLEINAPTDEAIIVVPSGRTNINAAVPRLPQFAMQDLYNGEQIIALNVPGTYAQHADINDGRLVVNANTNVSSLGVRNGGRVEVAAGALTTSGEIELQAGRLQGQITGATAIRKITNGYGRLGDLPGFTGEIIVDQGFLRIGSSAGFGTGAGATRITAARDAVLMVHGESVVYDDIYLNNASGVNYTGGLQMSYEVYPQPLTMYVEGRVDLGDVGAWIGGHRDGLIQFDGPITGGALNKVGDLSLRINTYNTRYTGPTNVRQGILFLSGNGFLTSTSAVNLYDDDDSDRGMLYVDNELANSSSPNRIADNIPIVFHGGWLHQAAGTEKYGSFDFQRGESLIDGTGKMTVGAISREHGAIATVQTSQTIAIDAAPQMTGGIIPWMTSRTLGDGINFNPFATVVNGQIRAYTNYVGITGATSASNVALANPTTLAADQELNSLALRLNGSIDLGGNDLTVHSGGLNLGYGGAIKNGTITAGAGQELIVHGVGGFSAAITDNATGPVDVTYAPGAASYSTFIEGNNTYTGKTFVNTGELYIKTPAALPTGGDVVINGGTVILNYASDLSMHLGHVRIGSYGSLLLPSESTISFDELVLEQGTFGSGKLVGQAPIYKRTTGAAGIGASAAATYSGQVTVEEGRLEANIPNAKYRVEGGTLVLATGANQVTLSGGELEYFLFKGNIAVEEASRITPQHPGNALNYGLTGSFSGDGALLVKSKLPLGEDYGSSATHVSIQGHSPAYHGDVDIDTAIVSIRYSDSLGTGRIKVLPAGVLDFSPLQLNANDSKLELANDVHLAGGELTGMDTVFARGKLLGDLYVTGRSLIGTIDTIGAVHLAHGSRLTTTDYYDTNFMGDVLVGGTAELMVGRERVRSSGLGVTRGTVRLAGRIISDAPMSLLKIDNAGIDDLELTASFHVQAGQTLGVTVAGDYTPLEIAAASLTGSGTLLNPVVLGAGGKLAPGQSPGTLSFANDLTLGPDAVYQWEINDAAGVAGGPAGWDQVQIAEKLLLEASATDPLIIEVSGLNALNQPGAVASFNPLQSHQWLVAQAASIEGFDPAAVRFTFAGPSSANPTFRAENFSLRADGNRLFIDYQYVIPEPHSLVMAAAAASLAFVRKRRSRPRG